MTETERPERDILHIFRRACQLGRPDIADFMLSALETLNGRLQGSAPDDRPVTEAYRDIAKAPHSRRN